MRAALVAKAVRDARRVLSECMAMLVLAVEEAQRIALKTRAAVRAKLFEMRTEELLQPLAIDGTTLGTADGIEMQLQLLQAESAQEFDGKHDDFCVNCRTCLAQSLHAELVELAVASRLRTVIAEH